MKLFLPLLVAAACTLAAVSSQAATLTVVDESVEITNATIVTGNTINAQFRATGDITVRIDKDFIGENLNVAIIATVFVNNVPFSTGNQASYFGPLTLNPPTENPVFFTIGFNRFVGSQGLLTERFIAQEGSYNVQTIILIAPRQGFPENFNRIEYREDRTFALVVPEPSPLPTAAGAGAALALVVGTVAARRQKRAESPF